MKTLDSTKLTVVLKEPGVEKTKKQNLANITPNPEEAQIFDLGDILASFAPDATICESVIKTEQVSYRK
ncbi:hypothetical protein RV11_GL001839 [Enterococcus phoeniculicola]|jgi:hypothetical protein|uniref:DUF1659 domain-containing protein n=1 Tax=Enterococcus phoeniculicola ATCC BAA-412 TaxID=1158610 RepID=R3W9F4_9ENTE|nr:hypothetical protein [Enterococcus phoeniculicola]EOL44092.1 hypothetical protein UC3_01722 [Enterococcus phoeniculicola ATCC BAA-412]EOT75194.1 hypothetical protein I589_02794 [Enterococcus phoeniculicola ATCC BAA-412]OJG69936.1 hypothetical protein RV11_GL001839 [Enterococcus phoeniculicola]